MRTLFLSTLMTGLALTASAETVAWYRFDEGSAGTAARGDAQVKNACCEATKVKSRSTSGNRFTAVDAFLPAYETGIRGLAMRFGAQESPACTPAYFGSVLLVESETDPTVWPTDELTVECFVKTTMADGDFDTFAPIFGKLTSTGSSPYANEAFALYLCKDGGVSCRVCTTGGAPKSAGTKGRGTVVNDGAWHHVALVFSAAAGTVTAYVDYASAFEMSVSGTLDYGYCKKGERPYGFAKAFLIGGYPHVGANGGRKFNGSIDELRVSDKALGPSDFLKGDVRPGPAVGAVAAELLK